MKNISDRDFKLSEIQKRITTLKMNHGNTLNTLSANRDADLLTARSNADVMAEDRQFQHDTRSDGLRQWALGQVLDDRRRVEDKEYSSEEKQLDRDFTSSENSLNRDLTSSENALNRSHTSSESALERTFRETMSRLGYTHDEKMAGISFTHQKSNVRIKY